MIIIAVGFYGGDNMAESLLQWKCFASSSSLSSNPAKTDFALCPSGVNNVKSQLRTGVNDFP